MEKIDHYLQAATRENTRRSYASAVRHFEVEWGGFLPATADSMARYLVDHAEKLSINTLKQRLVALAQWHNDQGFPDPTKAPLVRKVLKGIQALHPAQEKQAVPLLVDQLGQVVQWIEAAATNANIKGDRQAQLRLTRDKALLLLGFWRGFRGDELQRLRIEYIELNPRGGMRCFLSQSKGDRQLNGKVFKVPALTKLCPVAAYSDWIELAGLADGPVFRGIDRWGKISGSGLHINSLIPLLRKLFTQAGLADPEHFSSHSLRRGFAGWANANGWDVKSLMEYVGWKDVKSALRYIDGVDPFSLSTMAAPAPAALIRSMAAPEVRNGNNPNPSLQVTGNHTELILTLALSRFSKLVRGLSKAHRLIEEICLTPFKMQRLDKEGHQYRLTLYWEKEDDLDESIAVLLDDMHRIADNHQCFLDVSLHDPAGGRHWD